MDVFGPKDMLRLIAHRDGSSPPPDARQQSFLDAIEKFRQQQGDQPAGAAQMPVNPAAMPQDVGSGMGAVAQALAYRANAPQTPDQLAAGSDPWSGMRRQPMGLGRIFGQRQ